MGEEKVDESPKKRQRPKFDLRALICKDIRKIKGVETPKCVNEGRTGKMEIFNAWNTCGDVVESPEQTLRDECRICFEGNFQKEKGGARTGWEEAHIACDNDFERIKTRAKEGQTIILQVIIEDVHTFTIEKRCLQGQQMWCLTQGYTENYHGFWWSGLNENEGTSTAMLAKVNESLQQNRDKWGKGRPLTGDAIRDLIRELETLLKNPYSSEEAQGAWKSLPFLDGSPLVIKEARMVVIPAIDNDGKPVNRRGYVSIDTKEPVKLRIREAIVLDKSVEGKNLEKIRRKQGRLAEPFVTHALLMRASAAMAAAAGRSPASKKLRRVGSL